MNAIRILALLAVFLTLSVSPAGATSQPDHGAAPASETALPIIAQRLGAPDANVFLGFDSTHEGFRGLYVIGARPFQP